MHWLGITGGHREKSQHWCGGRGCLGSKELSVAEIRHKHTQGVRDGKMFEKCYGSVWDWHLQRCAEEALQKTHSYRVYSFLHVTKQKVNFTGLFPAPELARGAMIQWISHRPECQHSWLICSCALTAIEGLFLGIKWFLGWQCQPLPGPSSPSARAFHA